MIFHWRFPWNELSDDSNSYVNRLPKAEDLHVGVIACRFDWLVPVEATHLEGEMVHLVLNESHHSVLWSNRVFNRYSRC